jgi:hypothetical protein
MQMQIDNLTLEKELGRGQFGSVYLTKLDNDNTPYATKFTIDKQLKNLKICLDI